MPPSPLAYFALLARANLALAIIRVADGLDALGFERTAERLSVTALRVQGLGWLRDVVREGFEPHVRDLRNERCAQEGSR